MGVKVNGSKNPIKLIGGGLLALVIGALMLWFNEGNNVKNIKTVEEARGALVNIKVNEIDKNNEGKLVSTNGEIQVVDEFLLDEQFGFKVYGTGHLLRRVEMYQWVEKEENDGDTTTYSYDKVWDDEINDSSKFNQKNHENPTTMPYESYNIYANEIKLGAFNLSSEQIQMLTATTSVPLDGTIVIPDGYVKNGNYITNSKNSAAPEVGDIRISYVKNNYSVVSILAKQDGNSFTGYTSEAGKVLNELKEGKLSGEEMINVVESQNNTLKWIFRIFGIIFIVVGCNCLVGPIINLLEFIPLLGKFVSGIIGLIASLIGFAISLIIIAIAWIFYRPVFGICLLGGAILLIVVSILLFNSKKKKAKLAGAEQGQVVQPQPMMQSQMPQQPVMQQYQQQVMQPQQQFIQSQQQAMQMQQSVINQQVMSQQQMCQQPMQNQMVQPIVPVIEQPVQAPPQVQQGFIEQNAVFAQIQSQYEQNPDQFVDETAQEIAKRENSSVEQQGDPMAIFNQQIDLSATSVPQNGQNNQGQ